MLIKQTLMLILLGLLSAMTIQAQDEIIKVETNLVTVNVALRDKQGKFVTGLRPEQFEVFDNQSKQQISHFSAEEAAVSYGIVYDMHPTTDERAAAVLDSLRAFTKSLKADDRFFIIAFNERGNSQLDFIPTVEQIQNNLKKNDPRSLYDAIYTAADKLRESQNSKRTLLVISDSADHRSRHSFADLSKQLKTLDVQIYAVMFDEADIWNYSDLTRSGERRGKISGDASRLDRAALAGLTIKSGGTAMSPVTVSVQNLFSIYRQIAAEMRDSYTLGFYPSETANGKWHELRIGLRSVEGSKKFALTYRQGYQSPVIKR